jgi:hypothetical protein
MIDVPLDVCVCKVSWSVWTLGDLVPNQIRTLLVVICNSDKSNQIKSVNESHGLNRFAICHNIIFYCMEEHLAFMINICALDMAVSSQP